VLGNDTIKTEEIEKEFEKFDLSPKSIVISGEKNEIAVLRFDSVLSESKMNEVKNYYMDKYDSEPNVSIVSPIVGQELVKNAIYALAIASVGMIIYVTFRFEIFFAITAIIALLHDVFFMLVVFSFTRIE